MVGCRAARTTLTPALDCIMLNITSFEKLYVHQLKDLYSGEKQIINALPKMIKKAANEELRQALEEHLEETKRQKERLESLFENLDFAPDGEKCEGMEGILEENEEVLEGDEIEDEEIRDAAIIAGAQRVEHYEIAGYGTARQYAERLGRDEDVRVLQEILDEESHADDLLSKIAIDVVNPRAAAE